MDFVSEFINRVGVSDLTVTETKNGCRVYDPLTRRRFFLHKFDGCPLMFKIRIQKKDMWVLVPEIIAFISFGEIPDEWDLEMRELEMSRNNIN